MPFVSLSPNMSLPVPTVGVEPGPQYAFDLNAALTILDGHDHSSGAGVPVGVSGLSIDADLSMNTFNLVDILASRYTPQGAALVGPNDKNQTYVIGVDLWYNDGNGTAIRLTQSGSIAGTTGSISGLVTPASASYVSGDQAFVWQSAVNVAANLDAGSITLRPLTISAFGIEISAPNTLPGDYTLSLPNNLPTTLGALSSDAAGNIVWVNDYDAVVGSAAQVTAGMATHSTIASAITAAGANGIVKVLRGAWTENVTVPSGTQLIGMGTGSVVTGNLSITSATKAVVKGLVFSGDLSVTSGNKAYLSDVSIGGDVTFDAASTGCVMVESYVAALSDVNDFGTGNYIQLTQE